MVNWINNFIFEYDSVIITRLAIIRTISIAILT
jgi:hypothetical protein